MSRPKTPNQPPSATSEAGFGGRVAGPGNPVLLLEALVSPEAPAVLSRSGRHQPRNRHYAQILVATPAQSPRPRHNTRTCPGWQLYASCVDRLESISARFQARKFSMSGVGGGRFSETLIARGGDVISLDCVHEHCLGTQWRTRRR